MADMDDPIRGYLPLDTEGNGMFDYKKPADAPEQPRMAAICMIRCTPDLEVESVYSRFIRPNGWTMHPDATAVNGLTDEFLNEHGVPIEEVLNEYVSAIENGYVFAAHHAQHDAKQIRGELRRAGMDDRFKETPNICTMRSMVKICKLPQEGRGGYKWPKLGEVLDFIRAPNTADHSAENDAKGVLEILRYLRKTNQMPEHRVHYAKNRPGGET